MEVVLSLFQDLGRISNRPGYSVKFDIAFCLDYLKVAALDVVFYKDCVD